MFDREPLEIKFIQKASPTLSERDAFSYAHIYKFFTRNKLKYIVRVEKHANNVYVLKYYASRNKKRDDKYSIIVSSNDAISILRTCLEIMIMTLEKDELASFGFNASCSIDIDKKEPLSNNQRYRVYTGLVYRTIGNKTFEHYEFPEISSYLLINRKMGNTDELKERIKDNFLSIYNFEAFL